MMVTTDHATCVIYFSTNYRRLKLDKHLTVMYEIKRQCLLSAFIQNPELFAASLAFAYYKRLAPILNEGIMREHYAGEDPFSGAYVVKAKFIERVLEYVDECDRQGRHEAIEFYNLETKFGGCRMKLKYIMEYARIDGRFDDDTYKAIERNAPVEANSIASKFTPMDVYFD